MANEDLVAQYNQVLWQLGQLHEEAKIAGEGYQSKLKAIRKRSDRLNAELHSLGSALRKRYALPGPQGVSTGGNSFPQPIGTGWEVGIPTNAAMNG